MTKKKGEYLCRSYYLYLPKQMAEPLIGRDLKVMRYKEGVLIEPLQKLDIERNGPVPQV